MSDEQVKHMVNRFLGWRLPENFRPDGGVQFDADAAKKLDPRNLRYQPYGTNLLDATQAEAMVRHMIADLPKPPAAEAEAAVGRAVYARVSELIGADDPELAELDVLANIVVAAEAAVLQPQPQE